MTYVVSDWNGEKITGSLYEKELPKTSQEKFRIEKVLKRKGEMEMESHFNSWIDKKDLM